MGALARSWYIQRGRSAMRAPTEEHFLTRLNKKGWIVADFSTHAAQLEQSTRLRQAVLKRAFEGRLVKDSAEQNISKR